MRLVRVVLLGLVVLASSTSFAVEPKAGADRAQIKEDFKQANSLYNLGKFLEAAKLYESVYERYPDNALLYNIAQSYRLGNDAEHAVFFYRNYLRNEPKSPRKVEVNARIADLNAVLKAQASAKGRGSAVPVQPTALRTEPTLPPAAPEPVAKVEPTPTPVSKPSESKTAPIDDPPVDPPPVARPADPPPATANPELVASTEKKSERKPVYKQWWLWTIVGVVVVAGVGVGVGLALAPGPKFKTNFPDIGPGTGALVQF